MRNDEYSGELDYDIDVEVFTSIIFGNATNVGRTGCTVSLR